MVTANIVLEILGIILSLIPIIYLLSNQRYRQKLNLYFLGVAFSNAFMIIGDLAGWFIQDASEPLMKIMLTFFSVVYYVASAFILYFFARYMDEYPTLSGRVKKLYLAAISTMCRYRFFCRYKPDYRLIFLCR